MKNISDSLDFSINKFLNSKEKKLTFDILYPIILFTELLERYGYDEIDPDESQPNYPKVMDGGFKYYYNNLTDKTSLVLSGSIYYGNYELTKHSI